MYPTANFNGVPYTSASFNFGCNNVTALIFASIRPIGNPNNLSETMATLFTTRNFAITATQPENEFIDNQPVLNNTIGSLALSGQGSIAITIYEQELYQGQANCVSKPTSNYALFISDLPAYFGVPEVICKSIRFSLSCL